MRIDRANPFYIPRIPEECLEHGLDLLKSKVVGVGNAGSAFVNRMIGSGLRDAEFAVIGTDKVTVSNSRAQRIIWLDLSAFGVRRRLCPAARDVGIKRNTG